jgi:hypothetical protein
VVGKSEVLDASRRTAAANGGRPLGRDRFARETGIQQGEWLGRYWARWGDALREAGFEPNQMQGRYGEEDMLGVLVAEVRRLGRVPPYAELKMRRREDDSFPSVGVFSRWRSKAELVARLQAYCRERSDCGGVEQVLAAQAEELAKRAASYGEDGAHDDPECFWLCLPVEVWPLLQDRPVERCGAPCGSWHFNCRSGLCEFM